MSINNEAILAFVGALAGGVITFFVTLVQTNSNRKNLESQIKSEIDKIKLQYNLEQRRDDRNFLYKLKLEKSSQLADELVNYLRQISKSYDQIQQYVYKTHDFSELDELERLFLLRKLEDSNQELIRVLSKEQIILVRYLPETKEGHTRLAERYFDFCNYIIDNFTYPGKANCLDEDINFKNLSDMHKKLISELLAFQNQISTNMESILLDLEGKDL